MSEEENIGRPLTTDDRQQQEEIIPADEIIAPETCRP